MEPPEEVENVEIQSDEPARPLSIPLLRNDAMEPSSNVQKQGAEDEHWKRTLEKAIKSIVSISFIVPKTFDTWQPGSYSATGFIVDAERGIILSNKHVLTDAPWIGKVSFRNSEEVPVWPIYRDPIHDFGFLKFDTKAVKFMKLQAIELAPEEARVGVSIRVPGADAGEKLAILSGIIARTDRQAAHYGTGTYNDFNTFYIQSSANSSGGSSGSPIINHQGKAVAINAGGSTSAASSFFLPVERVVVALEHLKRGEKVPRGTVQVEFVQRSYDDCRRLGLPLETERALRNCNEDLSGALSVRHVIPHGPAWNKLYTGDVIVKLNGKVVNHFVELAAVLDDAAQDLYLGQDSENPSFGQTVTFTVFRSRKFVDVQVPVQDLHAITPDCYVEVGGSIVHALSYQLARGYLHPVGAVYVADHGHMLSLAGVPSNSIITAVAHKPTPTLQDFIKVMSQIQDNQRVPIRYYKLSKKHVEMTRIVTMDKSWARFRMAHRNDLTGLWDYQDLLSEQGTNLITTKPSGRYIPIPNLGDSHYTRIARKVQKSLVVVDFRAPFGVDGVSGKWADGVGCIVDAELGLVLVDRSSLITPLGRCSITFANQLVVSAEIIFIHPFHNFAILQYDVEQVKDRLSPPPESLLPSTKSKLRPGDQVAIVTMTLNTHAIRAMVTEVKARGFFLFNDSSPPKFRVMNFDEAVTLNKTTGDESGVITDLEGNVCAFWNRYESTFVGQTFEEDGMIETCLRGVRESVLKKQRGESRPSIGVPCMRVVDYEWTETYFWKARELGLDDVWLNRIVASGHEGMRPMTASLDDVGTGEFIEDVDEEDSQILVPKYSVISVRRVPAKPIDEDGEDLREGDLILTINDRIVTQMRDLYQVVLQESDMATQSVKLHILRDGQEMDLIVPTKLLSGQANVSVVHWAGAVFQRPHRAIYFHVKHLPRGVYLSLLYSGTPAQRDGLAATWFVTEVNGKSTETLEDLLLAVEGPDWNSKVNVVDPIGKGWEGIGQETLGGDVQGTRSYKIKLVSLENVQKVLTLEVSQTSQVYSPTWRAVVEGKL